MEKSGVADEVLSLPSGGGAVTGVGGAFATDRQTGSGSVSVPVEVPPGRNDAAPDLSLTYRTGNGNGPFGMGWALGTRTVSRKTDDGVPGYGGEDAFLLGGAELVALDPGESDPAADGPFESTAAATGYRPRDEAAFARITRYRDADTDHWTVETTDGVVSRFGTPGRRGEDPAAVADPADPDRAFTWELTEVVAPNGDRTEYRYRRDAGADGHRRWDALYPASVRYAGYEDPDGDGPDPDDGGAGNDRRHLVSVEFDYGERPDPFSNHRAGFEVHTRLRCESIAVWVDAGDRELVRRYDLGYRDEGGAESEEAGDGPGPGTVSLLASVDVTGYRGSGGDDDGDRESQRLPATTFEYATFDPSRRDLRPLAGEYPRRSLAAPDLDLADLNGDGLPDLVEIADGVRYWRNLGDGEFGSVRRMDRAPAGFDLADPGVQLLDADGDGRIDLFVDDDRYRGYVPLDRNGEWDARGFHRYDAVPGVSLGDPDTALVDLDGDGVTDALHAGERFTCFFQDPGAGWTRTRTVEREDRSVFPDVSLSDPRIQVTDLSGDGLADVVRLENGSVSYWPNLGHGDWGPRIRMGNAPRFPADYDPDRALLGDVDGDGFADLVYVENGAVTVWRNVGGHSWTTPLVVEGTPRVTDPDAVRLVDLLGTGVSGVLWSADGRAGDATDQFLDLTGETRPHLLVASDNGMGGSTRVAYAPSTDEYLAGERGDRPAWKTTLPFPKWVVTRTETRDRITGATHVAENEYRHGHYDGAEREFRGFGAVVQRDTESFAAYRGPDLHDDPAFNGRDEREIEGDPAPVAHDGSGPGDRPDGGSGDLTYAPPVETRTWFHLGPVGPERGDWRELDYADEFWNGDPSLLSRPDDTERTLRALGRRKRRAAIRALRGRKLRTEVYGRDDGPRADRPYGVTEHGYGLRDERPDAGFEGAVFFAFGDAVRETAWERGSDPHTTFSFTGGYDEFGQATTSLRIAAPRGWRPGDASDEYLVSYGETTYATPGSGSDRHVVDRTATETTYAVTVTDQVTVPELRSRVEAGEFDRELTGHGRNHYDGEAFVGRPLGSVGDRGTLVRTESLVLTDRLIGEVYGGDGTDPDGDGIAPAAPYLPSAAPDWPAEYPAAFRESLAGRAGYRAVDIADLTGPGGPTTGYLAASKRVAYDFQDDGVDTDLGLAVAEMDPLGAVTRIEYDRYGCKPVRVTDPDGLVTDVTYDYAAMKPRETTGPNGNRRGVTYTPLGLVAAEYERGPVPEGDGPLPDGTAHGDSPERPTVRYVYDLLAVERSTGGSGDENGDEPRPVSVHSIRRTKRRSKVIEEELERREAAGDPPLTGADVEALFADEQTAHPGRFAERRDYSDGLGRVVQTRVGAEAVVHAGADGGPALPADQDADPDPGAVVGTGDGERVRVSGWRTFDVKGNVVTEFQPFFDEGWSYRSRAATERDLPAAFEHRTDTHYDAQGRPIRTVGPDGAETREVRGTPRRVEDPDVFDPSPWVATSYDASDNAGRTHPDDPARHARDTPATDRVDPLGRVTESTVRTRDPSDPDGTVEELTTRKYHDVDGNLVSVVDPAGRTAFENRYDLAGNRIRTESVDSGASLVVYDAAGNAVEHRDGAGRLELTLYDDAGRVRRQWARDGPGEPVTLRQRVVYGDGASDRASARDRNLLGRVHRRHDEAGVLTVSGYDFAGAPTGTERRPLATGVLDGTDPVDWTPGPGESLQALADRLTGSGAHETGFEYDAAGRVTVRRYPTDVTGTATDLELRYTPSGSLSGVEAVRRSADGTETTETYVEAVGYDARERRILTVTGNGTMTRQAFDDATGRLLRTRTESCASVDPGPGELARYEPTGTVHGDVAHEYGVDGTLRSSRDVTPGSGVADAVHPDGEGGPVHGRDELVRRYEYDAMGRLVSATGRECRTTPTPRPWTDDAACGFDAAPGGTPTVTRANAPDQTSLYTERYAYDRAGNLVRLSHSRHDPGGDVSFTRRFGYGGHPPTDPATDRGGPAGPDNRLTHVGDDASPGSPTHGYDAVGNLLTEGNATHEWDFANRLVGFAEGAGDSVSLRARYAYDAEGNRTTKVVRKGEHRRERTDYVDGVFERHRLERRRDGQWETDAEYDTLHVADDGNRIALRHAGTPFDSEVPFGDGDRPAVEYVYGDRVGNATLVLDGDGDWYNHEEFTPFGETTFGGYARKRFRHAGRERDEESGLSYVGLRYYAPWLCRWTTTDPLGAVDDLNLYLYTQNDPVNRIDPNGGQTEERQEATTELRKSGALMLAEEVNGMPVLVQEVSFEPKKIEGRIWSRTGSETTGGAAKSGGTTGAAPASTSQTGDDDPGQTVANADRAVGAARSALGVAAAPKNTSGLPFEGSTNLWSGSGGETMAKITPGSTIHQHAYYQDWEYWNKHLKHYYGKYGELGGTQYYEGKFTNVWGPASADLGFETGLSGKGFRSFGLEDVPEADMRSGRNIQVGTEIPAYLKGSLVSGGLDVGGGALSIWSATYIDDPLVSSIGIAGGVAELGGGALRIGGGFVAANSYTPSVISGAGTATVVGSGLARFGGGGGMAITSGYMLYQDYQKGDVVNGVGNGAGVFTGGAILVGSGAGTGVGASFVVGYGFGRVYDEYNPLSMATGKPLSTHTADLMFYVLGPFPFL